MGEIFDTYKRNKKSPITHICVIMVLYGAWFFATCDNMHLITGYVNCCAKCHFHPFLPFSSITMPRYCKILSVAKTPENSTFPLYQAIYSH